jgi:DNA processing protein
MSPETASGFAEPAAAVLPPPATDEAERVARLRLVRSRRVGPATYLRLMGEHGDAGAALAALPAIAREAGVSDYTPCPEPVALAELRAARRAGARMLLLGDADYPAALAQIADAPPVLWAQGRMSLLSRPVLALVGTRNASALGTRMARRLAADLGAAGLVVVSGLARGVDALAHRAALETGTVAVMAGGLDVVYPAENADLARNIAKRGLVLSEMPFGLHPQARHFPRRNRIVAGLSRAVVVIEAAARSGSLITARLALDQGREVMAVPGHPLDSRASGSNILIRDGATLVRSAEDVLEALGDVAAATPHPRPPVRVPAPAPEPAPSPPRTPARRADAPPEGGDEAAILALLGPEPVAEDQLIRDLGRPPRAVAQALAILELAGRIRRGAGGLVSRA